MAFIPLTLRDSFFRDPFFRSTWSEFDRLHEEMARLATRDFWNLADQEIRQMGHRNQGQDRVEDKSEDKKSEVKSEEQKSNDKSESKEVTNVKQDQMIFPRRWMLPRLFGDLESGVSKALDIFQNNSDFNEVRIHDDNDKFELSLDTHGFRPDELKINVKDNVLRIDGQHEDKSEDRYVSRSFHRHYMLPKGCEVDKITSNLSKDGILVINAPKNPALMTDGPKAIPIKNEK